jgi:hypothetical protein
MVMLPPASVFFLKIHSFSIALRPSGRSTNLVRFFLIGFYHRSCSFVCSMKYVNPLSRSESVWILYLTSIFYGYYFRSANCMNIVGYIVKSSYEILYDFFTNSAETCLNLLRIWEELYESSVNDVMLFLWTDICMEQVLLWFLEETYTELVWIFFILCEKTLRYLCQTSMNFFDFF